MRFSGSLIEVGHSWLFRVIVVVFPSPSVSEITPLSLSYNTEVVRLSASVTELM